MDKNLFAFFDKEDRNKLNCPNCGDLHYEFNLNHSSTNNTYAHLGISSTLYGVCKKCADKHSGKKSLI